MNVTVLEELLLISMATVAESRSHQPYPLVLQRQVPVQLLGLLLLQQPPVPLLGLLFPQQLREPALRLGQLGQLQRPQAPILRNNRQQVSLAVTADLPSRDLYSTRYSPLAAIEANE